MQLIIHLTWPWILGQKKPVEWTQCTAVRTDLPSLDTKSLTPVMESQWQGGKPPRPQKVDMNAYEAAPQHFLLRPRLLGIRLMGWLLIAMDHSPHSLLSTKKNHHFLSFIDHLLDLSLQLPLHLQHPANAKTINCSLRLCERLAWSIFDWSFLILVIMYVIYTYTILKSCKCINNLEII